MHRKPISHISRRTLLAAGAISTLTLVALLAAGCTPKDDKGTDTTASASPGASGAPAAGGKTLKIAVIPKGTSHEYWKSIHAGANKAQAELKAAGTNVDILWKGPAKEDDRNGQIEVVETFLSQQVDGIVIAPLDSDALAHPIEEAADKKVPVVVIDSGVKTDKMVSYVATDNEKGGELGAKRLEELLAGGKRVLMMPYLQGSASTELREKGFLKEINTVPGIKIVSSDQFAGASVETAHNTAQTLLSRYGKDIDGIFTSNESATRGMILALKEAGLAGKVKLVGFDSSPDLIASLKAGDVQGLVLQDPVKMGYLGVKTVVDAINGKTVDKKIDTGVTIVTKENLDDPKVKDLVTPATVDN